MLRTKSVTCEFLKAITDQGTFEGILSPYNVVDLGGDLVEPGAFAKTLQEKGPKRPLLWQHETDSPIGELVLEDRIDGLYCKGRLVLSLPDAEKAYQCIKAGIVTGLSIGYQSMRDAIQNGVRCLKEIRLLEGSIVTLPMSEMALITSVKGQDETRIRAALQEFKTDVLAALQH